MTSCDVLVHVNKDFDTIYDLVFVLHCCTRCYGRYDTSTNKHLQRDQCDVVGAYFLDGFKDGHEHVGVVVGTLSLNNGNQTLQTHAAINVFLG